LTSRPKPVVELSAAIPARVSAIVSQALEKDPANRPARADDLVNALEIDTAPERGTLIRVTLPIDRQEP